MDAPAPWPSALSDIYNGPGVYRTYDPGPLAHGNWNVPAGMLDDLPPLERARVLIANGQEDALTPYERALLRQHANR